MANFVQEIASCRLNKAAEQKTRGEMIERLMGDIVEVCAKDDGRQCMLVMAWVVYRLTFTMSMRIINIGDDNASGHM